MDRELLKSATEYLRESVAPVANQIDQSSEALKEALQGLCDRELMALKRPKAYGGPDVTESEFRTFQEEVARASGALAFLQTQHQSAVGLIAKSANESLKNEYLPQMANGQKLVGIGFSQLRRPGPPMVSAVPKGDGYVLQGHVPWVTGEGFFPEFLIGAQLPDGRAVFGIVPFTSTETLLVGEIMHLAAMDSARTTTVDLHDHYLSADHVVDIKPAGWIFRNDQINITLQGFFAIGCARAGIDVVRAAYRKRSDEKLLHAADQLEAELEECREKMLVAQAGGDETTEEKLALRAWAITLATRCAHAGIAATGGAANSISHPAQRILRESLVFTVSAQTPEIMHATLQQILGQRSR